MPRNRLAAANQNSIGPVSWGLILLVVGNIVMWLSPMPESPSPRGPYRSEPKCAGDCRNGYGIYEWKAGRYEGSFVNGLQEGLGVQYWPDGSVHEGEYVAGRRHGRGVYTWPDNAVYYGDYVKGQKHGYGVFRMDDHEHHLGQWAHELRHGRGVNKIYVQQTFGGTDEQVQEGLFHKGDFKRRDNADLQVKHAIDTAAVAVNLAATAHLQALELRKTLLGDEKPSWEILLKTPEQNQIFRSKYLGFIAQEERARKHAENPEAMLHLTPVEAMPLTAELVEIDRVSNRALEDEIVGSI